MYWSAMSVGVVGGGVVELVDVGVAVAEVTSKWGVFVGFEGLWEDGSIVVVI